MSEDIVIKVEHVSKRYLLNQRRSGDGLRHVLQDRLGAPWRALKEQLKRETLKTETGSISASQHLNITASSELEEFWALKDVSFEVKRGEVVGIIGRNGAGKSTLLKILSRITEPTSGQVEIDGRVASLLEVGTGFHPELTGRENIYLNGAILGMKRSEIRRKFDEIVAFAEVEKFLDTPVKRYSSGMYVRLAFAVAAHLEPEILVVDEVLAVGDSTFQKKCLGKMQDVAREDGRTILFVSHNMAAVSRLCQRAVHLVQGRVVAVGAAQTIVGSYLAAATDLRGSWQRPSGSRLPEKVGIFAACVRDGSGGQVAVIPHGSPLTIELDCREFVVTTTWMLRVSIYDQQGNELMTAQDPEAAASRGACPGRELRARCTFPAGLLRPGIYNIGVSVCESSGDMAVALYEEHEPMFSFEVSTQGFSYHPGRALMGASAQWSFV
jgi:lipopolysaccharide transport system ATP-binding protein